METRSASLEGRVDQEVVSTGSKSERLDYVLRSTTGETYTLRRQGENAFVDSSLASLVGRSIRANGVVADHLFIIRDWKTTD